MHELDADTVLALARELGHDWIDRETATRIATGASAAIRAVLEAEQASAVGASPPASFIDELSALAGGAT